jgi:hypothetical protein
VARGSRFAFEIDGTAAAAPDLQRQYTGTAGRIENGR